VVTGAAGAAIALCCIRDPNFAFLPRDRRAEWIRFPAAVDARAHNVASVDATFRQVFTLDQAPRQAELALRGAKRFEVQINGTRLDVRSSGNWKEISSAEVANSLRAGENIVEARVFNDNAPPALWFALTANQLNIRSDATWDAAFTGSAWRKAALCRTPMLPGRGNAIGGGEQIGAALIKSWLRLLLFAAIAIVTLLASAVASQRLQIPSRHPRLLQTIGPLLLLSGLWLILFWHNTATLPFRVGFDSEAHLNYIKYIQERHALPLPNEGFEMFQPPLYYLLSALALSAFHLTTADTSAIPVLRLLTMLCGIAHFTLVFFALRRLFPGRIALQLIGLILAAFLPMQLYLSHFVTNETLAAVLVSAAVYVAILALNRASPSTALYCLLGLLVGAAMLTKTTSVLLVPPLVFACAVRLRAKRAPLIAWMRTLGLMLVISFAVCGWHYLRIWRHFGTPLLGNWDIRSGFAWWQDPGYRTAADYLRFGRSLVAPLFSGHNGFADGVYSTLWGDSLCAGSSDLIARLPWNYNLIVAGYVLAFAPTVLILIGFVVAIYRALLGPTSSLWLILGFSGTVLLALIFMTLKVPSYAQVKAFYGLSALIPFCAFAVAGWEVITRGRKFLQVVLGTILCVWAINSFASVWIVRDASERVYAALRFSTQDKIDIAADEAAQAVAADFSNAQARRVNSVVLDRLGRASDALAQAEKAVELRPDQSANHLQLATILHQQQQTGRAIEEARRAIELGPETKSAHNLLAICLLESARNDEASAAARDGLALFPFDGELHYLLGSAAAAKDDFVTATDQFSYVLLFYKNSAAAVSKLGQALAALISGPDAPQRVREAALSAPDLPETLDHLAWLLATHPDPLLRDGELATRLAQRACDLTHRKEAVLLGTLAAAYGESGRFDTAIATANEALALARSSNDADTVVIAQNLLTAFQTHQPYRNAPR
jgi:tetratricopeptide (TPR) repeat protein